MKHVLVYQFTCCVIHREGNMLSRGWTVQSYVYQKNVKKKPIYYFCMGIIPYLTMYQWWAPLGLANLLFFTSSSVIPEDTLRIRYPVNANPATNGHLQYLKIVDEFYCGWIRSCEFTYICLALRRAVVIPGSVEISGNGYFITHFGCFFPFLLVIVLAIEEVGQASLAPGHDWWNDGF